MPYSDGNPTLGEQIEEDARMRFYTDDLVKEGLELARENARLRTALMKISKARRFINGMVYSPMPEHLAYAEQTIDVAKAVLEKLSVSAPPSEES